MPLRWIETETDVSESHFVRFIRGRQTSDAIFALRQVMEKYREKQKRMYVAFIFLEKAYDRVPRSEVGRCFRDKGVSEKYVRLVQDMYDGVIEEITIKVRLHQGSALSPFLFDLIMPPWEMLFADDVMLVCKTNPQLNRQLSRWKTALEEKGFKISRTKTEYLQINDDEDLDDMKMDEEIIKKVQAFKYLGGMHVSDYGELSIEISHRIQCGWNAWRKLSSVLCDKKMKVRLKRKVYKTAVHPAMMYGSETWGVKKTPEIKMTVVEMKMLHWMCRVTKKDKIRNELIRGTVKVADISLKMQERRLK